MRAAYALLMFLSCNTTGALLQSRYPVPAAAPRSLTHTAQELPTLWQRCKRPIALTAATAGSLYLAYRFYKTYTTPACSQQPPTTPPPVIPLTPSTNMHFTLPETDIKSSMPLCKLDARIDLSSYEQLQQMPTTQPALTAYGLQQAYFLRNSIPKQHIMQSSSIEADSSKHCAYFAVAEDTFAYLSANGPIFTSPMGIKVLRAGTWSTILGDIQKQVPDDRQLAYGISLSPNGNYLAWLCKKETTGRMPSKNFLYIIYVYVYAYDTARRSYDPTPILCHQCNKKTGAYFHDAPNIQFNYQNETEVLLPEDNYGEFSIFNLATKKQIRKITCNLPPLKHYETFAWSSQTDRILVREDGSATLFLCNATTGERLATITTDTDSNSIKAHADGNFIVHDFNADKGTPWLKLTPPNTHSSTWTTQLLFPQEVLAEATNPNNIVFLPRTRRVMYFNAPRRIYELASIDMYSY